ncbi:MAG: ABC transporter ATP-binding protein/permease [Clostridiales bacterium]|nr:ABC transporter ATP-binding protein/permease [Clostridiales bacterium]
MKNIKDLSFWTDMKRNKNCIRYLLGFFGLKRGKGCAYLILKTTITAVDAVISLLYTIIPGLIINSLYDEIGYKTAAVYAAVLASIPLFNHLKEMTLRIKCSRLERELRRIFQAEFQSYIADMEYASLEDPNISMFTMMFSEHAPEAPFEMLDFIERLFSAVIRIFTISYIIIYMNPSVIALLIAAIAINSWVTKKLNEINHGYEMKQWRIEQRCQVAASNASSSKNGKETRIFGTKDFFIECYAKVARERNDLFRENMRIDGKWRTVHTVTSALQTAFLYAVAVVKVIAGTLAVGSMTIFISAAGQFSGTLSSIFNVYLEITSYTLDIEELMKFRSNATSKENSGERVPEYREDSVIEFHDVSFKYPGSDRYALRHLSIKLEANKKLSIVGENGSGKTTFIKLLTRLYLPTEGEITLDGVNIREFDPEKYQKLFAPVLQDFCLYTLPLSQNITFEEECDREKLKEALRKADIDNLAAKSAKGVDTYVGKSVDPEGFEPSGGEGQKIAIARAIYHDAPIYLLDEPTAALDPFAEYEIYKRFDEMITNRGAVLVTHRMSAVKLAENIAVFHDGNIIEYGTHSELYAKGGIYTEMFDKQAEFYRES